MVQNKQQAIHSCQNTYFPYVAHGIKTYLQMYDKTTAQKLKLVPGSIPDVFSSTVGTMKKIITCTQYCILTRSCHLVTQQLH